MAMIIFVAIFSVFVFESRSYPLALPFPFPSGYGSGPGFGISVNAPGYGVSTGGSGYGISVDNSNQILTPLANVGDTVNAKITQVVNSKQIQVNTPFPDSGRQSPVLESQYRESLPIQADIKYGNLQQTVANFLNPRPIVDTIQEHEKYGNDGSKGRAVSTLVVNAFEGLSNGLNALVDVPFQIAKQVGRKITDTLNPVGAKLVGLA